MSKDKKTTPVVDKTAGVNTEESRFAEKKANETPAVETPAVETAAVETPAIETPTVETPAVETPAVETPTVETPAVETHEATIIPSGRFIAENGNEYEFAVGQFTFQGKVYTKEEALSDHPDVLEHLASLKSFILKKV